MSSFVHLRKKQKEAKESTGVQSTSMAVHTAGAFEVPAVSCNFFLQSKTRQQGFLSDVRSRTCAALAMSYACSTRQVLLRFWTVFLLQLHQSVMLKLCDPPRPGPIQRRGKPKPQIAGVKGAAIKGFKAWGLAQSFPFWGCCCNRLMHRQMRK